MEEEGLNTLENRILNLEKALGFPEENSPTKLKLESKQLSLINKLQFVEYKTKEIYMSQIHNLIEKENDLNFLIKNYDNIPQAYNLLKQKLIIVLENRDFLEKTANKLTKINKTKKFLDYSLVLSLQGNLKNLRKLLFENNKLEEEQNLLEEKFKNLIQINGNVFNDLNTYLINLDYIISEKEQKKS